jgi:hypothetical protein
MADDVNTRGNKLGAYKGIAERMSRTASTKTGAMVALEKQIEETERKKVHTLDYLKEQTEKIKAGGEFPKTFAEDIKRHQAADARFDESIRYTEAKLEGEKAKREQIARNQFESSAKNLAENRTRSSVEVARHRIEARNAIASGKYTEASIESGINRVGAQLDTRTQKLIDEASDPKGKYEDYVESARQLEGSKDKYGMLTESHKELRRQGLDSASVLDTSISKRSSILDRRQSEDLAYKVASGGGGSMKEQGEKLQQAEERFLEAQQKFTEAVSSGAEDVEGFKKSLIDSTKALDDQSKLVKEMQKQGAGGGGNILRGIATAGQAVGIGANIYANATVASENQQLGLRAQYARFQNMGFMDHYAATQGDMAAYNQVTGSAYGRASQLGAEQQKQQQAANITGMAGDVATTTARAAIKLGKTSFLAPGAGLAEAAEVGLDAAPRLANQGIDIAKGLTAGQAGLTGANARYDLTRATNEIKSQAMQEFYNSSMGNFAASQGFGSKRSDVMQNMQSSRMAMAGLGMNAEDTQSLYQTAIGSMGAEFTKRGAGGMQSLVQRSAEVGRSGITSAQDYLSRIGQIAQAGGGDKQIEDIMANAVARGVDDAKSFGAMVDSISSLSSGAASKGIDVTGAMTRNISASMDALKGNGMNTQLNLNEAQQQAKHLSDMTGDTGMTFAGVMEQAQLSKMGGSMATRVNAAGLKLEETQSLQKMIKSGDLTKARTTARNLGVSEYFFDEKGNVKDDANETASKLVDTKRQKIASELYAVTDKDRADRISRGEFRNEGDYALAQQAGLTKGGIAQLNGGEPAKSTLKDIRGDAAAAQQGKVAGATGRAKNAAAGEEMGGGLGAITKTMQAMADSLAPIAASITASNSAGSMRLDATAFDGSVKDFDKAVKLLLAALDEKGGPGTKLPVPAAPAPNMNRHGRWK